LLPVYPTLSPLESHLKYQLRLRQVTPWSRQFRSRSPFGQNHTGAVRCCPAPESTPAVKPRESKSKSHAWSSTTASRKSSPPRKLHEESKIPLRNRRQRSPTPESRRYRGRDEQIVKERCRLMERLRELDREQDDARSRTPDRRGIPRP